ncbi:hypothetical protein [Blastococcus sp. SYSU D00820]
MVLAVVGVWAVLAVLVAVVFAALGRGGRQADEASGYLSDQELALAVSAAPPAAPRR